MTPPRTVTIQVPISTDCHPSQVMAFLDFIEDLHHALWDAYEKPLLNLIGQEIKKDEPTALQNGCDDEVPF